MAISATAKETEQSELKHSNDSLDLKRFSLSLSAEVVESDWGRAYRLIVEDWQSADMETFSPISSCGTAIDAPPCAAMDNPSDNANKNTVKNAFKRRSKISELFLEVKQLLIAKKFN